MPHPRPHQPRFREEFDMVTTQYPPATSQSDVPRPVGRQRLAENLDFGKQKPIFKRVAGVIGRFVSNDIPEALAIRCFVSKKLPEVPRKLSPAPEQPGNETSWEDYDLAYASEEAQETSLAQPEECWVQEELENNTLLFASDDQACLPHFLKLWDDPEAEPVDQSLFADFDYSYNEEARSKRSPQNAENEIILLRSGSQGSNRISWCSSEKVHTRGMRFSYPGAQI